MCRICTMRVPGEALMALVHRTPQDQGLQRLQAVQAVLQAQVVLVVVRRQRLSLAVACRCK